ncbi:hypothetical protein HMPREF9377_02349 [Enterococcus faecalis R712]|nr:hypothetical protein HMPREF9377_02349 [Enterococcus faecalis R712]
MFHFNTKHQKAIAENFLSSTLATSICYFSLTRELKSAYCFFDMLA